MRLAVLCIGVLGLAGCKGVIYGGPQTGAQAPGQPDQPGQPGSSGSGGVAPPIGNDGRYICDQATHGAIAQARRLTPQEYKDAITDLFSGGVAPSAKYPGLYGSSVTGYTTEAGITLVGEQGVEQLLYSAEDVAEALAPKLGSLLPCAAQADQACAESFLQTFGRRAFRRVLTDSERTGLVAVYSAERSDGATFAEAVAVMASQLLQMPAFLYVTEAPAPAGADRKLEGLELATRLSLHLWNSVPDSQLLDLAESGGLNSKETVLGQAQRMLQDPKSDRAFTRFLREWTQVEPLSVGEKDATTFDYLDKGFADSINGSFDRFAVDQVRNGTLYSLLRSNSAFVDANLAPFLGVPGVTDWTKVDLSADRYSGIMTQPAMMAALAHAAETSYVFRGRFIRKRLLCGVLGLPPGNAMTEFATLQKPVDPTAKDLSGLVQSRGDCGGCHRMIDPGGLAFEHFDAMGAYRDQYRSGKPIDTTGSLEGVGGGRIEFAGPTDMMEQLANLPEIRQCYARQMFRYSASRPESDSDLCAIQQLSDALETSAGRLDSAFLEATQTDSFSYRRGE